MFEKNICCKIVSWPSTFKDCPFEQEQVINVEGMPTIIKSQATKVIFKTDSSGRIRFGQHVLVQIKKVLSDKNKAIESLIFINKDGTMSFSVDILHISEDAEEKFDFFFNNFRTKEWHINHKIYTDDFAYLFILSSF